MSVKQANEVDLSLGLDLSVSGSEGIGYQWYRNGEPIPGATDPTYLITHEDQSRPSIMNRRLPMPIWWCTASTILSIVGAGQLGYWLAGLIS